MKFGIGIIPQNNLEEIIKISKLAEEVGFEYLWLADKPHNNTYQILEKIAEETEKIKLGPGVTNPYFKKIESTALEMINIDEISNNRAIFGIGPGDKQTLNELNIPWDSPVTTLKKSFEKIADVNSENSKHKIPIYLEASSPKLLELGGKYADGVLINASHPKDYDNIFQDIEKGIEFAKRDIVNFDIIAYTSTSIAKDSETARNTSKIAVAFIIAGSAPHVLENHQVPFNKASEIYINLCRGNIGGATRLVNDDLLNQFSVTGTPDEIIKRINVLKDKGVTQFVAGAPIGKELEESVRLFDDVISSFH